VLTNYKTQLIVKHFAAIILLFAVVMVALSAEAKDDASVCNNCLTDCYTTHTFKDVIYTLLVKETTLTNIPILQSV
jgi:hypothetical protein